jgi:release factor glutamine methyltransferase
VVGKEAFDYLVDGLKDKLGVREAIQVAKIYFQDIYGVVIPSLKNELTQKEQSALIKNKSLIEQGYPIVYLTGKTNFYGLEFSITPSVLIPSPETEELVRWMIEDLKNDSAKRILDVGTGSGCIAVALAKYLPKHKLSGIDVSEDALDVARKNALINDVSVGFSTLDAFADSFGAYMSQFDVVVSNPPYISFEDHRVEEFTRLHEPHVALFASNKGLAFYKCFANVLQSGQVLYLELNEYLASDIKAHYDNKNMNCQIKKDLQGKERMMKVWA